MTTTETHEIIQLLGNLVTLPSVNPYQDTERTSVPYGEARVADTVLRYFRALGVSVERQPVLPGRDNVVVRVPGRDAAAPPLLLEAHMDTVEANGMPAPFTPRLEGGRMYGRGTCDTKASLAAMMWSLRQVIQQGPPVSRGVCLVAAVDEEFMQSGVRRLVESGMRFSGAVVGEPTSLHVVPAHNGLLYLRVVARGQAAHTSAPQRGVNAIYTMTDAIHALRGGVASTYPFRHHPLCGNPQLTVSMIRGGSSAHVVPDQCEVIIDRRVIPGENWRQALDEIQGWIDASLDADTAQRIEVQPPYKVTLPVNTPTDHPLVQGLRQAVESVLGSAQIAGVPYNTDAAHLAAAGVPVVVFGPGDIAQAHTVGEYVEIDQVVAAGEILQQFLRP
jgi:acetylornithine deacetylase